MFWIYNKKTVSTKIRNNNIEFDIRDGLSENQRKVLFAIYFLNDSPKYEDVMTYENGITFDEIKKELKSNKIYNYSDNELKEIINGFSKHGSSSENKIWWTILSLNGAAKISRFTGLSTIKQLQLPGCHVFVCNSL